ncbi:MAG TPA: hypothetical protein VLL08_22290 [Kineosporiaceae bacterium]|nr:hypothetical protein [Kineosporiaceae bacterium]
MFQTDPTRYRSPAERPEGAVLVVGSEASGCQIADWFTGTVYIDGIRNPDDQSAVGSPPGPAATPPRSTRSAPAMSSPSNPARRTGFGS